jgi:hypothetical protein
METIEILVDKDVLAALRSSAQDFQEGKVYSDEGSGVIDGRIPAGFIRKPPRTKFQITPRIKIHHSITIGCDSRRTVFRQKTGERVIGLSLSSGKTVLHFHISRSCAKVSCLFTPTPKFFCFSPLFSTLVLLLPSSKVWRISFSSQSYYLSRPALFDLFSHYWLTPGAALPAAPRSISPFVAQIVSGSWPATPDT